MNSNEGEIMFNTNLAIDTLAEIELSERAATMARNQDVWNLENTWSQRVTARVSIRFTLGVPSDYPRAGRKPWPTEVVSMSDLVIDTRNPIPGGRYADVTESYLGYGTSGTSKCFAGFAVAMSGTKLRYDFSMNHLAAEYTEDGVWIVRAAREALGIEAPIGDRIEECVNCEKQGRCSKHRHRNWDVEVPALFSEYNNRDDLYRLVAEHSELHEEVLRKEVLHTVELREELRKSLVGSSDV